MVRKKVRRGDRLEIVALEPRFYEVPSQGLVIGNRVTVTHVFPATADSPTIIWGIPDNAGDVPGKWGWPFLTYNLGSAKELVCTDTM